MIRTMGLANFFTFVNLSHSRWCYHFFEVGLYCLNHHETQFNLSMSLRKTSNFLGVANFIYIVFLPWNICTLLLSTVRERIFYLEIPKKYNLFIRDTAAIRSLPLVWAQAPGKSLSFSRVWLGQGWEGQRWIWPPHCTGFVALHPAANNWSTKWGGQGLELLCSGNRMRELGVLSLERRRSQRDLRAPSSA